MTLVVHDLLHGQRRHVWSKDIALLITKKIRKHRQRYTRNTRRQSKVFFFAREVEEQAGRSRNLNSDKAAGE